MFQVHTVQYAHGNDEIKLNVILMSGYIALATLMFVFFILIYFENGNDIANTNIMMMQTTTTEMN